MASRDAVLKKPKDTKGTFIKLLRYLKDFKWILAVVVVLSITSNILSLKPRPVQGK